MIEYKCETDSVRLWTIASKYFTYFHVTTVSIDFVPSTCDNNNIVTTYDIKSGPK